MPFVRAIRRPPIVAPEGVHFDLDTADGCPRLVHCVATRAGLEFLAGKPLTIEQLDRVFNAHRLHIEAAARRKSNTGSGGKRVLPVTSGDLKPNGGSGPLGVDQDGLRAAHRGHV